MNVSKAKQQWLEVDEIKGKADEIQKDLKEANKSYNQRKKTYDGIIKKQEAMTQKTEELQDAYKKEVRLKSLVLVLELQMHVYKRITVVSKM